MNVGLGVIVSLFAGWWIVLAVRSLIATLETPLMPFWVWLAFQETPTARALIGGALVMGAVVADIAGEMRTRKR